MKAIFLKGFKFRNKLMKFMAVMRYSLPAVKIRTRSLVSQHDTYVFLCAFDIIRLIIMANITLILKGSLLSLSLCLLFIPMACVFKHLTLEYKVHSTFINCQRSKKCCYFHIHVSSHNQQIWFPENNTQLIESDVVCVSLNMIPFLIDI